MPDMKTPAPEAVLRSWLLRLDPKIQKLFRSVRTAVRKRLPAANEVAYDYTSFVVVGYTPNERGIDAIVAIAARANGVQLYFNQGPRLPDPKKLLLGSAKQTRFIWLEDAKRLAHPDIKALIAAAIEHATVPLPAKGKGKLIIRESAAKKRAKPKKAKSRRA
jgi:hypothetical protein